MRSSAGAGLRNAPPLPRTDSIDSGCRARQRRRYVFRIAFAVAFNGFTKSRCSRASCFILQKYSSLSILSAPVADRMRERRSAIACPLRAGAESMARVVITRATYTPTAGNEFSRRALRQPCLGLCAPLLAVLRSISPADRIITQFTRGNERQTVCAVGYGGYTDKSDRCGQLLGFPRG